MSGRIDLLLGRRNGDRGRSSEPPKRPRTGVAVLSCMDARLDLHRILRLEEGDAHILRNAGGTVTDDVILALAVSQRLLDTREILVMHHSDCAMAHVRGDELAAAVERDTGQRPPWQFRSSPDPVERLSDAVQLLASSPHLPDTELVRGVLYDDFADTLTELCERRGPRARRAEATQRLATEERTASG
jgi:carbonic anhydrase